MLEKTLLNNLNTTLNNAVKQSVISLFEGCEVFTQHVEAIISFKVIFG